MTLESEDPISILIQERGNEINNADLDKIGDLLLDYPFEEEAERRAWLGESLFLIVNNGDYKGDIDLDKLPDWMAG